MHHKVKVTVGNGGEDLPEESARLLLLQPILRHNVIKDLPSVCQLCDEIDRGGSIKYVMKLDDVRVGQQLQDPHFSLQSLHLRGGGDLLLLDSLDRHPLSTDHVVCLQHLPVAALAQRSDHPVLPDLLHLSLILTKLRNGRKEKKRKEKKRKESKVGGKG
jgi:hypothetical protein